MNGNKRRTCRQRRRRRRASIPAATPSVGAVFGTGRSAVPLAAEAFDETMVAQLSTDLVNTASLVVAIHGLERWPDEPRFRLFSFLHNRGGFTIRADDRTFTRLFEMSLQCIPETTDVAVRKNTLRAAIEAAALEHSDAPEVAAAAIMDRLRQVRAGRCATHASLVKQIRAVAAAGDNEADADGDADPQQLARAFQESKRAMLGLAGTSNPVWLYFRAEHYEYDGRRFCRRADADVEAELTGFMQGQGIADLTGRLVADVRVNLEGLTHLMTDIDPPFYIDDLASGEVTQRNYVAVQNGIINLSDIGAEEGIGDAAPILLEHDSRWFSEIALPYPYDPSATCPLFMEVLGQILPLEQEGDRRQQVLQEFAGYCLHPDCRYEKMLILYGRGGNGKSVLCNVLIDMLAHQNVAHVAFGELAREFRLDSLRGKAANIIMDMQHLDRTDEGLLKQLVSGESRTVNRKHKSPISHKFSTKLVAATNSLPSFSDSSNGIWRRLIAMPFLQHFPEDVANKTLSRQLRAELSGILNWAIEGLRRLLAQDQFTSCAVCTAALGEHRVDADNVREFVEKFCSRLPNSHVPKMKCQPLYEIYVYCCRARGRKACAENMFGKRHADMGVTRERAGTADSQGRRVYFYQGIVLNSTGREFQTALREEDLHRGDVDYFAVTLQEPGDTSDESETPS